MKKYNSYLIVVKYGSITEAHIAIRNGRYFHYDLNGPIGHSTIEYRNKRLVKYERIKEI